MPTPAIEQAIRRGGLEVFLYGTLLDPAVLWRRSGRRFAQGAARPAVLRGWRRVGLRGAPYPTLRRARHHLVPGLVLRLAGAPLRRLIAYEGAAYRLRPVRLLPVRLLPGRRGPGRPPRQAAAWVAHPLLAGN
ncbi:gamma-glutamylcyclotransferase family protein [Falsiroseomonas sp.]|uniref:gamma-glutamylcyclotransferase family protein n=1 Tax=Falsiroseomonas sp. TaxID=2870721 RepID=UPI003F6EDD6B